MTDKTSGRLGIKKQLITKYQKKGNDIMKRIRLVLGDITRQNTDAIVNSAHESLAPGGGVSGAIHAAAGSKLAEECREFHGLKAGEAVITKGYNLPAKYVIHTVAPRWYEEAPDREEKLRNCYIESLKLADEYGLDTVSFPSLGTGIFKTPVETGAKIAVKAVRDFLKDNDSIDYVVFVLYSDKVMKIYEELIYN